MKYILIIGAKSDIAKAIAKLYAKAGYNLYLACRNSAELKEFANDIMIRYSIDVVLKEFDIVNFDSHIDFYDKLITKPYGTVVVAGYMTSQMLCQDDFDKTLNTINVNFTGAVSILNIIANDYERKKKGFIVGISSVAGDRGRKSNYIYGASKAGFSAYLSGLRNRLYKSKVNVLTVKPGFVDTAMTKNMSLPKNLTSSSNFVANDIFKAQQNNKDTIYTKKIWWLIMLIIKFIPESIFKKLSI